MEKQNKKQSFNLLKPCLSFIARTEGFVHFSGLWGPDVFVFDSQINGVFFFVGQGIFDGLAVLDGFGINPHSFAGIERGNDHPVFLTVEQGQRKALVAANIAERVETDHSDLMNGGKGQFIGLRVGRSQLGQISFQSFNFLFLFQNDLFQISAFFSFEESFLDLAAFIEAPLLKNIPNQKQKQNGRENEIKKIHLFLFGKSFPHSVFF